MGFKKLNCVLILALMMSVLLPVTGCGNKQETSSDSSVLPDPDPSDPDSAPPNVVNDLGFYVKATTGNKFVAYMSKDGTFNTTCSVLTTAATSQDVECIVDAQESDLNFHGLTFNYNVPANFCKYMSMTPSWYYNYETGIGPTAIVMDITATGGVSSLDSCSITNQAGTTVSCTNADININADLSVSCVYDKSKADKPNCCIGDYTLTKNISGEGAGTTVTNEKWGGSYGACIGGPGSDSWSEKTKEGWPRSLVYYADQGLNEVWSIAAPIDKIRGNNYSISSYYTPAVKHAHTGWVDARASLLPYAVDPVDDRDGTLMKIANDSITFHCLDNAWEVKHRIKVRVREWNTYSEFLLFATSSGASGDPDVNGVEGVNCDYTNIFGGACNDHWDFDDLVDDLPGGIYNQALPVTERAKWFPREE